ncbi:MAG: GH92 family glycosyl hydrolase [Marinilabiliaceae bacterium]
MIKKIFFGIILMAVVLGCSQSGTSFTSYVNPFLGTAPLTDSADIGYEPPDGWRVWAGLTFPGAALPNGMVQLSPITEFGSGAGYEYEDSVIHGFAHTNKGHWNLCHIPVLPVSGEVNPRDFSSTFDHDNESARPGYYDVVLDRYDIQVQLTTTLRTGFHKYTYPDGTNKKLVLDLGVSNENVRDWDIEQVGENAFQGFQQTGDKVSFYATTNHPIREIDIVSEGDKEIALVMFEEEEGAPLEMGIGLSFVSSANAKANLEEELSNRSFDDVQHEADQIWETLLSKIEVSGGTEREKELFYSSLYRSFLWPALRSDVNGDFTDASGEVVNKGFDYYTLPALWDTYRNKLVLLGMLAPEVTNDVISSMIDRGEHSGFMPTFFHGDHAAPFIAGSYLRGLRDYDVESAYNLLLNNATKEGGTRPHIAEYMEEGYITTPEVEEPHVETKAKAAVTKTLEYAYDDYSLALLARELGEDEVYEQMMERSGNYKNLFDPSTRFMRGKLENGDWVKDFNPEYPYYEYMYREANAWQSTFFAPHDTKGLIGLFGSEEAFEQKLDSLYSEPWNGNYIARNVASFIGQYCHGNQPAHGFPFLYHFIDKPEKSQEILDNIMNHYYGLGEHGLALPGMDDAGEMSSWYVFSAMGFYPYSPADPEYIVSVPLFDEVRISAGDSGAFTIRKEGSGRKMKAISIDGNQLEDYFLSHPSILNGSEMVVSTSE